MAHPALRPPGIHPDRVRVLADGPPRDRGPVVYWMERAQRTRANAALAHALAIAAELGRPVSVVVGFWPPGFAPPSGRATARAATFALEGLRDVREGLASRGVGFDLLLGRPPEVALAAAQRAAVLVTDRAHLRDARAWRFEVAEAAVCPVVEVEADTIVPVEVASPKLEVGARTLRPKLQRLVDAYLDEVPDARAAVPWTVGDRPGLPFEEVSAELDDIAALVRRLDVDDRVPSVAALHPGGELAAAARLEAFVGDALSRYAEDRNQPHRARVSYLGMHLRYGHISPVAALQAVRRTSSASGSDTTAQPESVEDANVATFVEELLVRRELAVNFVAYQGAYDRYEAVPAWARRSLAAHADDPRPVLYDDETLLRFDTHDPYWNAAMRQTVVTGYQHNHMRMYWGKKVLEWSATPERAYERLRLWNDRFHLDGGDPNSYAGVGWVFGLHDRPWRERDVFGMVRYMNAAGLRRKTDPEAYVRFVDAQVAALAPARS
jgi:deoxyribodipyrimidine photo-lyase